MHRDAGTSNWKCICINFQCGVQHCDAFIRAQKGPRTTRQTDIKSQNARRGPNGRKDGHIILSLRGFEPLACGRMRCAHIWAARMNFNYRFKAVIPEKKYDKIYILKKINCNLLKNH